MRMLEYLEQDRQQLMHSLEEAKTPEKASAVMSKELERLLYQYNQACESERTRDAAAGMMLAARNTVPMVDSVGETRVWEYSGSETSGKAPVSKISRALLFGGFGSAAAALVTAATMRFGILGLVGVPVVILFLALAMFLMYMAGSKRNAPAAGSEKKERQVELLVDAPRLYRYMQALVMAMDQQLDTVGSEERYEAEQAKASEALAMPTSELDLFAGLLEAAYSKDGQYALDQISTVRFYLHQQKIDVIDYSEAYEQWFDIMPSGRTGTIRPALAADGRLLKKGLAAGGK